MGGALGAPQQFATHVFSSTKPDVSSSLPGESIESIDVEGGNVRIEGLGPWRLAGRRLRRNRVAVAALVVFVVMVFLSTAGATIYSHWTGRSPDDQNITGKIVRNGKKVDVVSPDGTPIGPALSKEYLLGADRLGRDSAVRLLYGGRASLFVGFMATLITVVLAVSLGLVAGFYRGWMDRVITSFFDIVWSFPVILLAIALGTALAVRGLNFLFLHVGQGSIWIPALIIGFVYVPYLGRPVRGQVLALREKEFVEAAVAQGMRPGRIMFSEILPNITSTIMVFGTLIIANDILTEAALSYLGAGVQPPTPSWGNLISDGTELISSAPALALAPGVAIVVTVLSLNLFGDGLRDALDPRAKVRLR